MCMRLILDNYNKFIMMSHILLTLIVDNINSGKAVPSQSVYGYTKEHYLPRLDENVTD